VSEFQAEAREQIPFDAFPLIGFGPDPLTLSADRENAPPDENPGRLIVPTVFYVHDALSRRSSSLGHGACALEIVSERIYLG
jgi:hypothetical protein